MFRKCSVTSSTKNYAWAGHRLNPAFHNDRPATICLNHQRILQTYSCIWSIFVEISLVATVGIARLTYKKTMETCCRNGSIQPISKPKKRKLISVESLSSPLDVVDIGILLSEH